MLVAPAIKYDNEQIKRKKKNNPGNELAFAVFFHGFKIMKLCKNSNLQYRAFYYALFDQF